VGSRGDTSRSRAAATATSKARSPICCGENRSLRHGFREVLEKRAADIIMPDMLDPEPRSAELLL
jgi:L-alanine-DL-glutamate epimerase-like enolase superfamily enzyme